MSTKQTLLDIGFSSEKIDLALSTCGDNLEQATEWLLAHADDPSTVPPSNETVDGNKGEAAADGDADKQKEEESETGAKSLKCDECGKLFKSSEEVEFHAVKSGHASFSESTEEKKPLTEEEKKQKLKDLEEKLTERRKKREEEEKKETLERERKRIQMGKNITETKQRMQEQEMKRIAEERRREKLEDKLARQRVKDQIERDRQDMKEARAAAQGQAPPQSVSASSTPQSAPATPIQKKNYDTARLQIRLPSGSPLVQEFNAKEPLSAVRLWVSLNRGDSPPGGASQPFSLSTTFPRKIFSDEDMDRPLNSLGLVPSAVLVVNNT